VGEELGRGGINGFTSETVKDSRPSNINELVFRQPLNYYATPPITAKFTTTHPKICARRCFIYT